MIKRGNCVIFLPLMMAACGSDDKVDGLIVSYRKEARPEALIVRVAPDGRASLKQDKNGIVSRGGVDWLVRMQRVQMNSKQYRLEPVAASRTDVMQLMAEREEERLQRIAAAGPAARRGITSYNLPDGRRIRFAPPKRIEFKVEQVGTEEVAGRRGTVWRVSAVGDRTPVGYEAVMSRDADLKPVGRLIAMHMAPVDVAALAPEGTARSLSGAMAAMFTKGTLLRLSMRTENGAATELFRLEKVEKARLGVGDFALPGRIFGQDALRKPGGAMIPVIDPPSKMT